MRKIERDNLIVAKTPKDLIDDSEEARSLMVPFAVRDAEKGFYLTGYTHQRLVISIDVCNLLERFIMRLFDDNPGRALRLLDHLRGKSIGRFPWMHRVQVKEDVKDLVSSLKGGGYYTEIKD